MRRSRTECIELAGPKRDYWDERYRSVDLVWGTEPNQFVAEAFGARQPAGRALDWGCGEGRNAIWLARRGWRVTAVDFSQVAVERGRQIAAREGVELEWIQADVTTFDPPPGAFALVLIAYLQLRAPDFHRALERAALALAPGGRLFGIGHARRNLAEGVGGPPHPSVLWDPDELDAQLRSLGLRIDRCEEVKRLVQTDDGPREAIDVLFEARREP